MISVLSVASRALVDACERLGLDTDAMLTAAGLSREEVLDPDARLPADKTDALWRQAYAAAGDPQLSLHAAAALPFGAYKVLDFVLANAATVGEGLLRLCRYFPIVDPRGQIVVEDSALVMASEGRGIPAPAQQYTFAAIVLRSRAAAGVPWAISQVDFTFDAPDDLTVHTRIFGDACRFGQAAARLVVPSASWSQRVEGANEALFSVLDDHAQRLLAELPEPELPFTDLLRRHVQAQLCGGDLSIAAVAKPMGMSERTLQRRLEELELSYSQVVGEVRHEVSESYLREPNVSIAEVAWLLGFSDQSAFGRAFKRWTGQSPGTWRRAHT